MPTDYAQELKQRRKKAKLTLKQLAKVVGINEKTIRNYEAGRTMPSPVIKRALDRALSQLAPQPAAQNNVSSTGTG